MASANDLGDAIFDTTVLVLLGNPEANFCLSEIELVLGDFLVPELTLSNGDLKEFVCELSPCLSPFSFFFVPNLALKLFMACIVFLLLTSCSITVLLLTEECLRVIFIFGGVSIVKGFLMGELYLAFF
jgi:hypothetical protein